MFLGKRFVEKYAVTTVTAGNLVSIDANDQVATTATATLNLVIGIAMNSVVGTATNPQLVTVQTWGLNDLGVAASAIDAPGASQAGDTMIIATNGGGITGATTAEAAAAPNAVVGKNLAAISNGAAGTIFLTIG